MKKMILFLLPVVAVAAAFIFYPDANDKLYKSAAGTVAFFSEAPIENIDATSNKIVSVLNSSTNEIAFSVAINTFQFDKAKMQVDFNENFMHSDKFPDATYKGAINEKVDWAVDGARIITSKGVLTIHGVAKERIDTATINISGGQVNLKSNFYVRVADHDIKIPQILYRNIAEVVSVKLAINYVSHSVSLTKTENASGQ